MSVMVEVNHLVKTYSRPDGKEIRAVKDISLNINKGEIFSLLGPNGAGKTTTISMISGLVTPTSGDAKIGGFSITQQPMQAKRLIGVIPQEIALYLELSPRQNLMFFGRLYDLSGAELKKRVDEVLDFVDLRERADDRVDTFSGGMKRRVNIAVGLLHRPQLIYMDEPTVGIDPQNRRRILDTVVRLRDEYKMTVLYTTHLMEESEELSDRVGIIDHGQIIALGTVGELTQQVGEEDRLVFNVGEQNISEELLNKIQSANENITRALFDAPQQDPEHPENIQSGKVTVFAKRGRKALPSVIMAFDSNGIEIQSVEVREPDLEAVFLHMTGRALRD
jgi:ABC-2 type transport system ATP-binding protein